MPFCQPWMKNSYPGLQVHYLNSPRQCKHLGQFKFLSRNISKSTPNIYPLYYIIRSTICLFVPCVLVWLHFCNETETNHSEIPARSTCHVSRERAVLDSIALRILITDCVKKNSISKLHVIGMPLNEQTISFFFLPYSSTHRRLVIPERVYNRDM